MGNEESRPDNVTFKLEIEDGVITVNAKKSTQVVQEADREIFNLIGEDKVIKRYLKNDMLAPYVCSSNTSDYNIDWGGAGRTLYPLNAKVVKQTNRLVTVQSTELKNPSNVKGEFTWNVNKSEIMKETYKRKWFAETNVTSKVNIAYKILTLGTIDFSRKTTEEVESEHIKTSKLSTQTEIKVTLKPNTSVRVELQAIFHAIDVEVEYEASLFGALQIGYGRLRVGALPIPNVLEIPEVPTTATYKEIITLEYYTDGDRITMTTISND